MIPTSFGYESPRSLGEALALLKSNPEAKVLAGGHSLLPAMKLRLTSPAVLVDLGRIAGLKYIRHTGDSFAIGAMTSHAEVESSEMLRASSPLLAETAACIGDVQVRNCGTLGGSLAHADPAADYPAAILALDADLVATSSSGERIIPARRFFTGLFSTALKPGEILTEVRVRSTGGSVAYKKFRHPASGFAVVGIAAVVKMKGANIESAAVGVTGVDASAYRARSVEKALRGKPASAIAEASGRAADGITGLSDNYASAEFRKHLACVFTERALQAAVARAGRK